MHTTRVVSLIITVVSSLVLAACAGADGADNDKAGGEAAPVTLRIGTDDMPGRPAADQIAEFARQVDELSGGTVQVEPVWHAAGQGLVDDWDQAVARMVVEGELDLAMIPARAWDTEGVTSLRALHAPFLVTSEELVSEIVTGELAGDMLAGLDEVGVTGLALLPEGLRYLFVFGDPPDSMADLGGGTVRAPTSETAFATFEALGAEPDDFGEDDAAFVRGIQDGSVIGAESSFALASSLPRPATAVADSALFPKVNSLVANTDAFTELPDEQQAVLREAAVATRDWAVENTAGEAEAAREYCSRGLAVADIGTDRKAMLGAVEPVYDMLEQDAATAEMIASIRDLAQGMVSASPPLTECEPSPLEAGGSTQDDPAVLNGVYRYEVTYEYLVGAGLPREQARIESGVHTVTVADGEFEDAWRNAGTENTCTGQYTVSGRRVTLRWSSGCHGDWMMTYERSGDEIRWSDIESLPPHNDAETQIANEAFNGVPWVRVGDAGSEPATASTAFPEGSYRNELSLQRLLDAGVDEPTAEDHAGLWTLTFRDGMFSDGTCDGTYTVDGGQVTATLGEGPECGTSAGAVLFSAGWELEGDSLMFVDVRSGHGFQRLIETVFGSEPFTKVD